jgi:hypothetical protein
MAQRHEVTVFISEPSVCPQLRESLERNNFLYKLGLSTIPVPPGDAIRFREDRNTKGLIDYLRAEWIGRGWVNVTQRVQDAIVMAVWEIYVNAFEHGASPIGVFTCGQHFPEREEFALTVVDFGVGIPRTVRTAGGMSKASDDEAIAWALRRGTTSKEGNRGVGLNILFDFVTLNHGRIDILSHAGLVQVSEGKIAARRVESHFTGTLLNITLKKDESRYFFEDETDDPLL